jgi:hypothetical protein
MPKIIVAGDEERRCLDIEELLIELNDKAEKPLLDLQVRRCCSDFGEEILDQIQTIVKLSEWSNPCVIAIDVNYTGDTGKFTGVTTVHDGLVGQNDRFPAKYVVWYSRFFGEGDTPERRVLSQMAEEREVSELLAAGLRNLESRQMAKRILELAKNCGENPDEQSEVTGLA